MIAGRNVTKTVALVVAGLALSTTMATTACSSSDDPSPVKPTDAGSTSAALSSSFSRRCARCHGAAGQGDGKYPKLPGKPDADSYVAFVRAGKGEMPAFASADISDADLRSDFAYLSGK